VVHQRLNDAHNAPYLQEHNAGLLTVEGRRVEHVFLTGRGPVAPRTWDFANDIYWDIMHSR
jgi:hypothetical protein